MIRLNKVQRLRLLWLHMCTLAWNLYVVSSVVFLRPLEVQVWQSGANDRECASGHLGDALHTTVGIAYCMSWVYVKHPGVPVYAVLRGAGLVSNQTTSVKLVTCRSTVYIFCTWSWNCNCRNTLILGTYSGGCIEFPLLGDTVAYCGVGRILCASICPEDIKFWSGV